MKEAAQPTMAAHRSRDGRRSTRSTEGMAKLLKVEEAENGKGASEI
jgi:hypothetical protein